MIQRIYKENYTIDPVAREHLDSICLELRNNIRDLADKYDLIDVEQYLISEIMATCCEERLLRQVKKRKGFTDS